MKFWLTENELCVLNKYMKSLTIKNHLRMHKIKLTKGEEPEATISLVSKSLLQEKNNKYELKDDVKPFSRGLDNADYRVLTARESDDMKALESTGICAVKKKTLVVFGMDQDMFTLEFYPASSINTVISNFLELDMNELYNSPLAPFLITMRSKHLEEFLESYENDKINTPKQYESVFGTSSENLKAIVSTIFENDCRSEFIVQTKDGYIMYSIYKKDGIIMVACRNQSIRGERTTISHQRIGEFVKWICP